MSVNLLPIELSPSGRSFKFAKLVNRMIIILTIIFVIFTSIGIALILFLSYQKNTIIQKEINLRKNIQSLRETEQKLFLVKERLDKIKNVRLKTNVENIFEPINQILSTLPPNTSVSQIQIDSTKADFQVISTDSLSMASFLNSLALNKDLKNLSLIGFSYSPGVGYSITLESI